MLIFNNNPNTMNWASFKQWLADTYTLVGSTLRILTSGIIVIGENIYPANYFAYSSSTKNFISQSDFPALEIPSIAVNYQSDWNSLTPINFSDGVNLIN